MTTESALWRSLRSNTTPAQKAAAGKVCAASSRVPAMLLLLTNVTCLLCGWVGFGTQSCHLPCCAGTHSEGGIWSTLFGLLMWDLLFTDVPEVAADPQSLARGPLSWPSPQLSTPAFGCSRNPVL